jgi:hypothetical protein
MIYPQLAAPRRPTLLNHAEVMLVESIERLPLTLGQIFYRFLGV